MISFEKQHISWEASPSSEPKWSFFDDGYPPQERIPRIFRIDFRQFCEGSRTIVALSRDGLSIGDPLTDNSYQDTGYRFHDVFHFTFAALLNWSPMTRKLLSCKRKSNSIIDEVEDGGRARVIEESICAITFDYAKKHKEFPFITKIGDSILRQIKSLTADLEVRVRSKRDWEIAAVEGFKVWRVMRENQGGSILGDLTRKNIEYTS